MFNRILSLTFVAALLSAALAASGAETVHLFLKGSKTASFNPDSKSGAFLAQANLASIKSPRDAASGQATGRRTYEPITFRKRIDKSTPLLFQALVTNEQIKEATFSFFRAGGGGQVEVYGVAKLTDAKIKNIRKVPSRGAAAPEWEEITFVFQKITWTEATVKVPRSKFIDWQWNDGG